LVLWKAMRVLSSSDTTSQAELDALFQQIKEHHDCDQLSAIEA
jgi:response regulator of citrate/malate metabolism